MRRFTLVLSLLLLVVIEVAFATVDPIADEKLPPVDTTLQKWAEAMEVDRPRQVTFQRIDYDTVFAIEKRGIGTFAVTPDARGRYTIAPAEIAESATKHDRDGKVYQVTASTPYQYCWTATHFYWLDPEAKFADQCRRDVEPTWWNLLSFLKDSGSTVPLILGFVNDEVFTEFQWTVDSDWMRRDTEFHLIGLPKSDVRFGKVAKRPWHFNFSRIEVLIDRRTHQTIALRFLDPGETRETVYVIDRVSDVTGEFWQPDLTGYEIRTPLSASATIEEPTEDSKVD